MFLVMKRSIFNCAVWFTFLIIIQVGCHSNHQDTNSVKKISAKDSLKLSNLLLNVFENDQKYRDLAMNAIHQYGYNSTQVKLLAKKMHCADSLNLITVKSIVKEYGWLSASEIGDVPNSTLFLVMQHAPFKDRKELLPAINEAAKVGSISMKNFTFFQDRLLLDEDKKQIYGTQMGFDTVSKSYYLFPIEHIDKVDQRRAKVGLAPLSVQMSEWNIKSIK